MTQNSVLDKLDKLDKLDRLEKGNGKIISFSERPSAHTARGSDGSQGCRDGGHKDFENYFPDFAVFHGGFWLRVECSESSESSECSDYSENSEYSDYSDYSDYSEYSEPPFPSPPS